jgi:uncharacterized Zn-binding protein involved in type VI secretion
MKIQYFVRLIAGVSFFFLATACSHQSPENSQSLSRLSIQEVMLHIVDPAADALWESVSVTATTKGDEVNQPKSDEEWKSLRGHAVTLIEAANLLHIRGRSVARSGKELDDAGTPGLFTAEEVSQEIAKNFDVFALAAKQLQDASIEALAAIDAQKPSAVLEAGVRIDQACENCHRTFWYPLAKGPDVSRFFPKEGSKP